MRYLGKQKGQKTNLVDARQTCGSMKISRRAQGQRSVSIVMLTEQMHTASTRNGNGEVLDVYEHREEVSGYNNGSNRDRLTMG